MCIFSAEVEAIYLQVKAEKNRITYDKSNDANIAEHEGDKLSKDFFALCEKRTFAFSSSEGSLTFHDIFNDLPFKPFK